jgi:LysM repeat protein
MKNTICILIAILIYAPPLFAKLVEVEVRTGDTLHAFASKYLKDPAQWPEIYNINKANVSNPNKIYPGQIIKIPIEMLKDKVGDISRLNNSVKVKKREGGDWKKGSKGARLFPEDGIKTGEKSFARVDFLVGSNLQVYENSLIYLKPTQHKTAVASLLSGGLNVEKAKIITPSAEVMPKGSSKYDIDVNDKKATKVSVRAGEVDVKAQGKTVTVMKGFRTMVEFNEAPQAPVALPLNGEEALEFKEDIMSSMDLNFHLQVSETEEFNNIIKHKETADLSVTFIKKGLKPGQYYWRAAIIDKDGFKGSYSRPRAFVVHLLSSATVELTGFEIVNREEGVMRITGYAKNARSVVVNGYPAMLDEKGGFTTTIILAQEQASLTVTAVGGDGIVLRKYRKTDDGMMWLPVK